MHFVLNGVPYHLDPDTAVERLRGVAPEPVRAHGVRIDGVTYPVKQAFELVTKVSRTGFTSQTAMRHLRALGFEVLSSPRPAIGYATTNAHPAPATAEDAAYRWPWEGSVQAVFANLLQERGWSITAAANTATKAPGVDILATKRERRLGAEVKGWPSTSYADPRRAAEVKRTQPSTQAGHWYSQALLKAMMVLDSHPGHESLVVLPHYPRYRDLAERTRSGLLAANIHVILLDSAGAFTSERWTP